MLVLFALVPMVLDMAIFYRSVKYVPIVHAGVIMMMEAVSGVVYGYVILGESIDYFTILGGTLILLASTMTIWVLVQKRNKMILKLDYYVIEKKHVVRKELNSSLSSCQGLK